MSNTLTLVITVAIVFFSLSTFITLFVIIYQRRQLNFKKSTEQLKINFNQTLLQTQLEIQEQTFQTISQEIHDNIGQTLSFIKLNINMIDIDKRDEAQDKLAESKKLLSKAIQDLRDISKMLNTDFINETGLVNAVVIQQLNILKKTGEYSTKIQTSGNVGKYQLQQELVVFRIVQELLNNIVKHAEANSINIEMNYLPEKLLIRVTDNGKGFDTTNINDGIGLRNMRSRMALINGSIVFESKKDEGATAIIELPKQKETPNGNI